MKSNNEIVEELFNSYDKLMTMALSVSRDLDQSRDLVQRLAFKLLEFDNEKLNKLHKNKKIANYCYSIIRNEFITDCRKNINFVDTDKDFVFKEDKEQVNYRNIIGGLLWDLEKYDRTLFYYHHVNDLSIREISKITKISKHKIEYSLCQSKKQITKNLTPNQKQRLIQNLKNLKD